MPTIVDLAPAAGWDEREAHDLYGVRFDGHEPLRPLVDHDLELAHWTVPVRGDDAYQVAVGPIHAGVIESGHFRFHVVGDRILHLDARLFYKHRGLERAAEGSTLDDGARLRRPRLRRLRRRERASPTPMPARTRSGSRPTAELARARTILLELERLWSHLNDIAAVCAGVGLAAGNNLLRRAHRARPPAQRRSSPATASSSAPSAVGGSDLDLDDAPIARRARGARRDRRATRRAAGASSLFNASFQDRLPDIGVVSAADASALGAVGPAARAAGVAEDARATAPRLAYHGLRARPRPTRRRRRPGPARAARARAPAVASRSSTALLDRPVSPRRRAPAAPRRRSASASSKPARRDALRRRTRRRPPRAAPSPHRLVRQLAVVAYAAADNLLPDFPLINKSFELCYACADR